MDARTRLSTSGSTPTREIFLGIAIVVIVAILIVPLPTLLLDLLIAANLTIAVAFLLASFFIRDPLKLAALPGFLLTTTLFRLGVNVSSTRLILLNADAGDVIAAFGDFVVQRNAIVGAVIFLILTMVQFLVIARGSERVAEVAARFSLDAMPGQQMAIDADLRAGAMNFRAARQRRRDLHSESRLFGAMDGAMKFIKGDAIAGILITIVNILGGLAIGLFQDGLPFSQAAHTYTLLTIGDGLASQIPALLIAAAAALVVSRLSADASTHHESLQLTLSRYLNILWLVAALFAILAIIPGLPALPFAVSAGVTLSLGLFAKRAKHLPVQDGVADLEHPSPLTIQFNPSLFTTTHQLDALNLCIAHSRSELRHLLGFPIPQPRLSSTPALAPNTFTILINEIPVLTSALTPEHKVVDQIDRQLKAVVPRHAASLLSLQDVQELLDQLREHAPALITATVPAVISLAELTHLLQRLLQGYIPIRHLQLILTALAKLGAASFPERLAAARVALKRHITHHFSPSDDTPLKVWLVEPSLIEQLREHVTPSTHSPNRSALHDAVLQAAQTLKGESPIIVIDADVRDTLHTILEDDHPAVVTLAFEELMPSLRLEPIGHLSTQAAKRPHD